MEMALRTEARTGFLILLLAAAAAAQPFAFPVRHRHWHKGGSGELRVTESGISFSDPRHAHEWSYEDIQQLLLSEETIRIRSYDDVGWKLGRDREDEFDSFPPEIVQQLYRFLRTRMDQRFIAALADPDIQPEWQLEAKLRDRLGGSDGTLLVSGNSVVYKCEAPGESRTWRFSDIDNIAGAGPFDLTITTFERIGLGRAPRREFRFQLKQPLSESRYNALWRELTLKGHDHE
jgi:hypothetical protein